MSESASIERDPLGRDSSWLLERVFSRSDVFRVFGGSFLKSDTGLRITKDFADGEDRYFVTLTGKGALRAEFRLFEEKLCLVGPVGEKIVLRPEDIEPIKRLAIPES